MRRAALALVCTLIATSLFAATAADYAAAGRAAMERDDVEAAVAAYAKAVAAEPLNAQHHFLLGTAYGRQAQRVNVLKQASLAKKTKAEFERAVELDPNLLEARFALIDYYLIAPGFMGGSEPKALAQAAEIKKRDALDGHRAYARVYMRQKKNDLARKEYVDAVREQPKSAKAHYFLGGFLMNEKNWDGSMHEYEMVLQLDPKFAPVLFRIGQHAARSATNYARGEQALREYLTHKPADNEPSLSAAWYWLGQVQEKQGKKAEAKQSYSKALELAPSSTEVKDALKRVS